MVLGLNTSSVKERACALPWLGVLTAGDCVRESQNLREKLKKCRTLKDLPELAQWELQTLRGPVRVWG